MTALGPIAVARVYFTCVACGLGRHPADAELGLDGHLSTQALRLVGSAGGQRSFANAEMLLTELCGWRVRDERIRQACHAEADRIAVWRADRPVPAGATVPPTEFQIDATEVNAFTGWRDMKIGASARHVGRADGADADHAAGVRGRRGDRRLRAPRWGGWAERLGRTCSATTGTASGSTSGGPWAGR